MSKLRNCLIILCLLNFIMIFSAGPVCSAPLEKSNFSHIKTAITNYSGETEPDLLAWLGRHFDIFKGGVSVLPYNPYALWPSYTDFCGVGRDEIPVLRQFAADNGFKMSDIILHVKENYAVMGESYWNGRDAFGAFGDTDKGVYRISDNAYTNLTVAAYDDVAGDVPLDATLMMGYGFPFAEVNFVLSQTASEASVQWSYWNGTAWNPLTPDSDGTSGFTQNGRVTFTPPPDWKVKSEDSSQEKFWVRVTVSSAAVYPVASRVYGDDWHADPADPTKCRGWARTDANIRNKGLDELEYNPTPPAGASAKFRYQAMLTGYRGYYNFIFGNLGNVQNGEHAFAKFRADRAMNDHLRTGSNGIFFDNTGFQPTAAVVGAGIISRTDFVDSTNSSWHTEWLNTYAAARSYIKAADQTVLIGANALAEDLALQGDYSSNEGFAITLWPSTTYFDKPASATGHIAFDSYLSANNPNNTKGIAMFMDTVDAKVDSYGVPFPYDRANRGPMTALALYYIGANENTYFQYNPEGYIYLFNDQYIAASLAEAATLSVDLAADPSYVGKNIIVSSSSSLPAAGKLLIGDDCLSFTKVDETTIATTDPLSHGHLAGEKIMNVSAGTVYRQHETATLPSLSGIHHWGIWFPAMGFDVGVPDVSGYNGGRRDLQFSDGAGGYVFRRDYTNAIMLVRSAVNATRAADFNNYRSPIVLHGTYRQLMADGTLGPAITEVSLRASEGVVLVKQIDAAMPILTVTTSGAGTVSVAPGSLAWSGATGSTSYNLGATVTLTPTPTAISNSGVVFKGWTGACIGTGDPATGNACVLTMDAAKSVTATFGAAPKITTAGLPDGISYVAYSKTLAAAGGTAPYTWTLSSGSALPPGMTLSATGVLSGTPTAAGDFTVTVQVRDSKLAVGTTTFTLHISPLVITTATLANVTVGTAAARSLAATGGVKPYTWSLAAGTLPPGMTLNAVTGAISGTATTAGAYDFTVTVTGSQIPTASVSKALRFTAVIGPLTITTATLANVTVGSAAARTLAAGGGLKPYAWSLAGGSLPPGLTLNAATGAISGTPTAAGTYELSLKVTDSQNPAVSTTKTLTLTVVVAPLSITTATLANVTVGTSAARTLVAGGGVKPYVWSLAVGSLLPGLTLNVATGAISGIPTVGGTYQFTVMVADSQTPVVSVTKSLSLTAVVAPLAITTAGLTTATVGVSYNTTLTATGGVKPYSWSVAKGSLPPGISLNSSLGRLTGKATAAGSYTFTVQVSDSAGTVTTDEKSLTVQ